MKFSYAFNIVHSPASLAWSNLSPSLPQQLWSLPFPYINSMSENEYTKLSQTTKNVTAKNGITAAAKMQSTSI